MDFFLGDAPGFAVVRIALIEEVGALVLVGEEVRMTALAAVPLAGLAVGLEGFIAEAGEVDAVLTAGYAYLLGTVVVGAGIEQPHLPVLYTDAGTFYTFAFPWELGEENALVGSQLPR